MSRVADAMAEALGIAESVNSVREAEREATAPLRAKIKQLTKDLRRSEQDRRAVVKTHERWKRGLPKNDRDWLAIVEQLEEEIRDLEMTIEDIEAAQERRREATPAAGGSGSTDHRRSIRTDASHLLDGAA